MRRPSGPRPTQLLTRGESRKSGQKNVSFNWGGARTFDPEKKNKIFLNFGVGLGGAGGDGRNSRQPKTLTGQSSLKLSHRTNLGKSKNWIKFGGPPQRNCTGVETATKSGDAQTQSFQFQGKRFVSLSVLSACEN
jgi:hypothetical protein